MVFVFIIPFSIIIISSILLVRFVRLLVFKSMSGELFKFYKRFLSQNIKDILVIKLYTVYEFSVSKYLIKKLEHFLEIGSSKSVYFLIIPHHIKKEVKTSHLLKK